MSTKSAHSKLLIAILTSHDRPNFFRQNKHTSLGLYIQGWISMSALIKENETSQTQYIQLQNKAHDSLQHNSPNETLQLKHMISTTLALLCLTVSNFLFDASALKY